MVGDFKIAVVNHLDDYSEKDYGFALYDEAKVGDLVVINTINTYGLATVKEILSQEAYGKIVTKEVVSVVDLSSYQSRITEREKAAKLEKDRKEIQKELDKKIAKLKDLEYYERLAKEFADKDPEIAAMASKLRELS